MRKDRFEAERLRRLGKSYREIHYALHIPKGTLSYWFKDTAWSSSLSKKLAGLARKKSARRMDILNKIRAEKLEAKYAEARVTASREFIKYKNSSAFIVGLATYWGEGDKPSRFHVRMSNTDPAMIRHFIRFLLGFCSIERKKVRVWLLLYPDLDDRECRAYWVKNGGIGFGQFTKSIIIKGRHKTRRSPYGVCNVVVSDSALKQKMLVWQKLLIEELDRKAAMV